MPLPSGDSVATPAWPRRSPRTTRNTSRRLLAQTAYISEVGLDGGACVAIDQQADVLASLLAQVSRTPRLVSVHSTRATKRTLDVIETSGASGVILHWWLGSDTETRRASELGCLFSVNRRMNPARLHRASVPLSSLLPETDHPSGNRSGSAPRQPGWTLDVEDSIASAYGTTPEAVRYQFWRNLVEQVDVLGVLSLLPPVVQAMLAHARWK